MDQLKKTESEITSQLAVAAEGYFRIGMGVFHQKKPFAASDQQVSIGNLAISVELLVKLILARINLTLFLKDVPMALKVAYAAPIDKSRASAVNSALVELRSGGLKTLDLNESLSTFYMVFPSSKPILNPYFRNLSEIRNIAVHSTLPAFQRHELKRVAYGAISLIRFLQEEKSLKFPEDFLSSDDSDFLETFDQQRHDQVAKKIAAARQVAKSGEQKTVKVAQSDFESLSAVCPICNSNGVLGGYTEESVDGDEDGNLELSLMFNADSFRCDGCLLKLEDPEELVIADIGTEYDRTEDIDLWGFDDGGLEEWKFEQNSRGY